MKAIEFNKGDQFRFANKREHGPEKTFTVHSTTTRWIHCRRPSSNGGELRYSFSDDYLKDAVIEIVKRVSDEPVKRHAVRAADKAIASTPIGETIRFEEVLEEGKLAV